GDFELATDPDDPAQNVLFASNVSGGSTARQDVVIARMDGATGQVIAGTRVTVANNFEGNSNQNGPSWMRTPAGNLGLLYVGADGVHGVFRNANPTRWDEFGYDYSGAPTYGAPPPIPDTTPGFYPGNPLLPPAKAATIPQYRGPCVSACYGYYDHGATTDTALAIAPLGYTLNAGTQAPWEAMVYFSACQTGTTICGLFQAKIDGMGGYARLTKIAATGARTSSSNAAVVHPVTGTVVLFTNEAPGYVTVWEQAASGAALAPVARIAAPGPPDHFRAQASDTQAVLSYLVRQGAAMGTYAIAVRARGGALSAGASTFIGGRASGSEFDWFPAAGRWAQTYRTAAGRYMRCWAAVEE
ncbi:MAG: hypothetical protein JSR21_16170, partial [Proteobacteria bacterium]|nr:hypothetical protein [Pseudomonadota bacterium]